MILPAMGRIFSGDDVADEDMAQRLWRLESIEAIKQLKARYCAACDADHDSALLKPLFTEDAVWEASGITRAEGWPQIDAYMSALRASGAIRNSAHNVFNPQISVSGHEAQGHWRLLMLHTANVEGGDVRYNRIIGWYRERYAYQGGEWLIASLYCEVEENAAYALAALPAG